MPRITITSEALAKIRTYQAIVLDRSKNNLSDSEAIEQMYNELQAQPKKEPK